MGSCFSCRCRSSSVLKTIRLVHLNGYVEDFEPPISVGQVISMSPKHFVCTAAQLLSTASLPLKPDDQLQPGSIYFLLPHSAFHADASPTDFASLVKRLTAKAKSVDPTSTSISTPGSLMEFPEERARSVGRRSWKPILDTIKEMSFTRRSDSDLREMYSITTK
ncbi:hypothetical protein SLEP1_g13039 [Rubroshorea leprosula]|uniref:DUF4228 domain protein n=1 Tax=Rubroshorea leprosula TaxID=152421 RepID=A0AAV5IEI1_9ROSI|nr:hypothetical protein SLEP1_g13039 [Rubroshorea leprosula]